MNRKYNQLLLHNQVVIITNFEKTKTFWLLQFTALCHCTHVKITNYLLTSLILNYNSSGFIPAKFSTNLHIQSTIIFFESLSPASVLHWQVFRIKQLWTKWNSNQQVKSFIFRETCAIFKLITQLRYSNLSIIYRWRQRQSYRGEP